MPGRKKTRKTTWMLRSPCPDLTFLSTRSRSSSSPSPRFALSLSLGSDYAVAAREEVGGRANGFPRMDPKSAEFAVVQHLHARATHSLHFAISVLPALPRPTLFQVRGAKRGLSTQIEDNTMITSAPSEVASSPFLTLTQEQDLEAGASGPRQEAYTGCTLSPSKKRHFLGRSPQFSLQISLQTHTTHERKQSQVPRCLPGSGGPCTAAATRPHFDSPCHAHATAAAAGVAEAVPLPPSLSS